MPNERHLVLYLHELLSYLSDRGVSSLLVLAQHGFLGADARAPVDISYLSDTVVLLRFFEFRGDVLRAISVHKRRTGAHERHIRQLQLTSKGPVIGEPLHDFENVLSGSPRFLGESLRAAEDTGEL